MKQRTLFIVAISLIVVSVIGLSFTLLIGTMTSSTSQRRDGVRGGDAGSADAMFIERMVPHHQDAIEMAELALTRSRRPEIRDLAQRIKTSQSAENELMRRWYEQWFGRAVPEVDDGGMMRGPMMGADTDLDRLRDADDFDREFIEQMVPHHQMGIMMSRMARRSATRPELQRLTDSIIESQTREIWEMQQLREEWYGR